MTADVTQLHPPLQHYAPCDRDVYGRAVAWYMEGDPNLITAENVRAFARDWRETGQPCDCKRSQMRTVLDDLAAAKKRFKACLTDAHADRVAELKVQLAWLRGMA